MASTTEQQLIKISWNDELRLVPVKSFEELIQECSARFSTPAAVLSLTYKDSDNDTITVTSDNELTSAISLFGQTNTRPKFNLEKKAKVPLAAIAPPVIAPEVIFPGNMKMIHPTNMAAHSLFLRRQRQLQQQQQQQQKPKTEEEKKAEEKQKKQQLKKQQQEKRLFELNHTRIVRLRWKESDGTPATSGPGCYFGLVDGKERKLSLDCGKGLKGFWLMRQLQDGDVVLASLLCPNRFLRMKDGVLEFNTGENGLWSRWVVIDEETGQKVTGNIMETLTNGKKIKLGSKSARGKFIGLKPVEGEEEKKREVCSSDEGVTFTLEAVENLKGVQVVRLCCSALSLVDPKVEEKEKKEESEQKEKKLQEQKEKKEQMEKKKQERKELMEKKLQEKKERIEKKQQEKREKKQVKEQQSSSDSE